MADFLLVHDAACDAPVHVEIYPDGSLRRAFPEEHQLRYRRAISVRVLGLGELSPPHGPAMTTLWDVLRDMRQRYPSIRLAAHRQVRGVEVICPGTDFPFAQLKTWWEKDLEAEAATRFDALLASAYVPRLD